MKKSIPAEKFTHHSHSRTVPTGSFASMRQHERAFLGVLKDQETNEKCGSDAAEKPQKKECCTARKLFFACLTIVRSVLLKNSVCFLQNIMIQSSAGLDLSAQNEIRLIKITAVSGSNHDQLLLCSFDHSMSSVLQALNKYLPDLYEKKHHRHKKQEKKKQNSITAKAQGNAQRV